MERNCGLLDGQFPQRKTTAAQILNIIRKFFPHPYRKFFPHPRLRFFPHPSTRMSTLGKGLPKFCHQSGGRRRKAVRHRY